MEVESMKKLKTSVEKCLEELSKKADLTPSETKAALDGMQLRDLLICEIENCRMDEGYSERGKMHHSYNPRQYHITSYGSYGRYYDDPWYGPNYGYGNEYSRHSIGDRVVEKLEQMMDQTGSDYEKEELHKFIRMIRQAAD